MVPIERHEHTGAPQKSGHLLYLIIKCGNWAHQIQLPLYWFNYKYGHLAQQWKAQPKEQRPKTNLIFLVLWQTTDNCRDQPLDEKISVFKGILHKEIPDNTKTHYKIAIWIVWC
jgi:hypothetical protein